jgi:hypothetical protein
MSLIANIRTMDKRLRVMLIATALLLVPGIGQFVTIRDLNTAGHPSALALLFAVFGIFAIPTSLILSGVIVYTVRHSWREHERLVILGVLNLLLILNLAWFFAHACSWAKIFGIALKTCS